MKKLLVGAFALLVTANLFAIEPVVKTGDFNVKKAKGTLATYTIDMSNLTVGEIDEGKFVGKTEKMDAYLARMDAENKDASYVKDWPGIVKEAKMYLVEEWNHEFKKGLKLTEKSSEATHKVVIKIDNIDFGRAAGMFAPYPKAGGAIVMGTVTVTDLATNKVVVSFKLQHVQGYAGFSDRLRTLSVMKEIVGEIEDVY